MHYLQLAVLYFCRTIHPTRPIDISTSQVYMNQSFLVESTTLKFALPIASYMYRSNHFSLKKWSKSDSTQWRVTGFKQSNNIHTPPYTLENQCKSYSLKIFKLRHQKQLPRQFLLIIIIKSSIISGTQWRMIV